MKQPIKKDLEATVETSENNLPVENPTSETAETVVEKPKTARKPVTPRAPRRAPVKKVAEKTADIVENEEPIVWHEPILDRYWDVLEAEIDLRRQQEIVTILLTYKLRI